MQKSKNLNTKSLYFSERITKALEEGFNYPITIVEAPMGYGKTVAVREHLNHSKANTLWQRILDTSITGFWHGFCRQLGTVDNERSKSLSSLGFPNDSVTMQEALKIIEGIEFAENTVLVIDDYHLAGNEAVNSFIEFLVRSEATDLHMVLTARYTEFSNLEELSLKGYLYYVNKEAFELLPKEIIAYYKQCGISIKDHEAESIYSLTEGWISALYLMMLNIINEGIYSKVTDIYKLIEKAVYASFSKEIKDFLITMCIFDSFSLELAQHMWGKSNTPAILSEISGKNAFVKYDNRSKTYQMHSLFTNFLRDKLEAGNFKPDLYRKAAQWFLKAREYETAINYFLFLNDYDSILQTLENEKAATNNPAYKKELTIHCIMECPEDVKAKHHFSMLLLAFRLFSFHEIDLFRKACSEFLLNLHKDETLDEYTRNRLLGEFEMVISFTGYNDVKKMGEHHLTAGKLLTEPSSIMCSNSIWTFGSPSILFMFYRESGKLEETICAMLEDIPVYSRVSNGNAAGGDYLIKAECYFNMGDYVNAQIFMHQGMYAAKQKKQITNIVCAMFLEIRIALIRGDYFQLTELLKKVREEVTNAREYLLIHTIELCEGYIYSLLEQDSRIPMWLESGDFNSYRLLFPVIPMVNIIYGRILLIEGEYLKIIGSADYFIGAASVFPNLMGIIYTYIYLAGANNRMFRKKESQESLIKALDIAMPDKVYMPFVENCDYISEVLTEIQRQNIYKEEIERILELYTSYHDAVKRIKVEHSSERKPVLTGRETEIAQLAAAGFSNNEIGEKLFISQNTVKTQLKSIFEKLGVGSRVLLKQFFKE